MTKCLNCGKTFKPNRKTAKFCSDRCRKQAQRLAGQNKLAGQVSVTKPEVSVTKVSVTDGVSVTNSQKVSVTKVSVTKDEVSVTKPGVSVTKNSVTKNSVPDKTEHKIIANNGLEVREGYCHACGKKVANSICICYECFKKGHTHESLGIPMCKTPQNNQAPNYKRNGMKNQKEALERMIAAASKVSSVLIMGNRVFDSKKVIKVAGMLR